MADKVKVLVMRFSSIGDIVLTTPVVRHLKQGLDGDAEVHYLTKKGFAPLLEANPYIDRIHTIEKHVSEVTEVLQAEHFDYVIDLHRNLRSSQVKRQLDALSFSLDKINRQKWLMVNLKVDRLPRVHIVDRYLDTIKAFGIPNDGKGLDHFIPEADEVPLTELPESHRNGYIALVLAGTYFTKVMPDEKLLALCRAIERPIVLLGGKAEQTKAHKLKAFLGDSVVNACGTYSINQSASLVRQASHVITHDTGLMHIAAAFQKPVISIWGNTIPEFGMYPYMPEHPERSIIIEVKGLRCRPCSKLGYGKCPKKHFNCMELIEVGDVVEALAP